MNVEKIEVTFEKKLIGIKIEPIRQITTEQLDKLTNCAIVMKKILKN